MVQFALSDSKMCLVFHKLKHIPEGRPLPPEILAQTDPSPPETSDLTRFFADCFYIMKL